MSVPWVRMVSTRRIRHQVQLCLLQVQVVIMKQLVTISVLMLVAVVLIPVLGHPFHALWFPALLPSCWKRILNLAGVTYKAF